MTEAKTDVLSRRGMAGFPPAVVAERRRPVWSFPLAAPPPPVFVAAAAADTVEGGRAAEDRAQPGRRE